ncbi:type IV conjugative transfer system lipoprotein TraV [Burkholderia sp. AU45388]|uniref:type IV conjugative transfer system lipoprotein TraV n=1 Tax=Burkholderia sp. AU45388 TaxID=3059206 RepID=UPI00264B1F1D|nr:type IV conjugative transfer system lipoprotein TraV [Burkholderia sp. AU45388]MDN7430811.1 type IV conjugative transfer system lipoprotein TraV [Burkholderia sp. AU45388]
MKNKIMLATSAALLGLTGCSFSGYDASSQFACKAPEGVLCSSMSGIYANAMAHNLPDQRVHTSAGATTNIALGSYAGDPASASSASGAAVGSNSRVGAAGILPKALDSGAPVHTASREMRIWFAPWQDADSDLHDQEYVYLIVDPGHWSIAHNQQRIQAAFRPVMPPAPAPDAGSSGSKAATSSPNTDSTSGSISSADRVMQGILTPAGAVDRAAAAMPAATDH